MGVSNISQKLKCGCKIELKIGDYTTHWEGIYALHPLNSIQAMISSETDRNKINFMLIFLLWITSEFWRIKRLNYWTINIRYLDLDFQRQN